MNIYLVRSPYKLLEQGCIGYGWPSVDFSKASTLAGLKAEYQARGIDYGRKWNQIARYYRISEGDLVVVPLKGTIAIARASGRKFFDGSVPYGENRIDVQFVSDKNGKAIKVSRKELSEKLSRRLKLRAAIGELDEFQSEIAGIYEKVLAEGAYSKTAKVAEIEESSAIEFKSQLLKRIRSGNTFLESGGYGLEKLVQELLQVDGYDAEIQAKNSISGPADADIRAERNDRFSQSKIIVQVKHHSGLTDKKGIDQLAELGDEDAALFLITSANVSPEVRSYGDQRQVEIIEGEELVDWIFDNWKSLSNASKSSLGISDIPQLLDM